MDAACLEMIKSIVKCSIHADCWWSSTAAEAVLHMQNLYNEIDVGEERTQFLHNCLGNMISGAVYGISDDYLVYYIVLRLPETSGYFFLGPSLLEDVTDEFLHRTMAHNGQPKESITFFRSFYHSLPVLDRATLHTIGRAIGTYFFGDKPREHKVFHAWKSIMSQPLPMDESARTMAQQLAVEQRKVRFDLLDAVKHGRRSEAFDLLASLPSPEVIDGQDSLRSLKDECILWLARFENSVSDADVPAVEAEAIKKEFLYKIESAQSISAIRTMLPALMRRYIAAVWDFSLPKCSPVVRHTAEKIRLNYDCSISVSSLAKENGVTLEHLSRAFHQQMGVSVVDFIHRERIRHAVHYLDETDLPIRDIALLVGYEDISYFSKVFRRILNCSPREYRNVAQGQFTPPPTKHSYDLLTDITP